MLLQACRNTCCSMLNTCCRHVVAELKDGHTLPRQTRTMLLCFHELLSNPLSMPWNQKHGQDWFEALQQDRLYTAVGNECEYDFSSTRSYPEGPNQCGRSDTVGHRSKLLGKSANAADKDVLTLPIPPIAASSLIHSLSPLSRKVEIKKSLLPRSEHFQQSIFPSGKDKLKRHTSHASPSTRRSQFPCTSSRQRALSGCPAAAPS
jgi:hypothetical protein